MPLSKHLAMVVHNLDFNLRVFRDSDMIPEVKTRLINESIEVLDEILLDPVFNYTLQLAYETNKGQESDNTFNEEVKLLIQGGKPLLDFIDKEKFLLQSAGFIEERVGLLIEETKQIIEAGLKGLIEPTEVFRTIVEMKFALIECLNNDKKIIRPQVMGRLALALGGAAMVLLNASALAVSLGMTVPLSALSSALGGTILTDNGKIFVNSLSEKSNN